MPTSDRQIASNRQNAQRSTGPNTPEGKKTSSMNALKHGMSARSFLLAWEDREAFEALADGLRQALSPEDSVEETMVERIIQLRWRMERGSRAESAAVQQAVAQDAEQGAWDPHVRQLRRDVKIVEPREMELIVRYETNIENRFYKALNEFRKYRGARQEARTKDEGHKAGPRVDESSRTN